MRGDSAWGSPFLLTVISDRWMQRNPGILVVRSTRRLLRLFFLTISSNGFEGKSLEIERAEVSWPGKATSESEIKQNKHFQISDALTHLMMFIYITTLGF